jgi:transposase-like protein
VNGAVIYGGIGMKKPVCPKCGSMDVKVKKSNPTVMDGKCKACGHKWRI